MLSIGASGPRGWSVVGPHRLRPPKRRPSPRPVSPLSPFRGEASVFPSGEGGASSLRGPGCPPPRLPVLQNHRCPREEALTRLGRRTPSWGSRSHPGRGRRSFGGSWDAPRSSASPPGPTAPAAAASKNTQLRPQIRRDDPLNLSILLSGGKETNKDSLSSGERRGKSPAPNPRPLSRGEGIVAYGRPLSRRGPGV